LHAEPNQERQHLRFAAAVVSSPQMFVNVCLVSAPAGTTPAKVKGTAG
jgi:hypothetical protein